MTQEDILQDSSYVGLKAKSMMLFFSFLALPWFFNTSWLLDSSFLFLPKENSEIHKLQSILYLLLPRIFKYIISIGLMLLRYNIWHKFKSYFNFGTSCIAFLHFGDQYVILPKWSTSNEA